MKARMAGHILAAGLLAAGIAGAGATQAAAETINFGIISTESTQNLKTQWEPFLEAMEAQTGLDIEAFFATDYNGVITAMGADKVQVAWYGNKSAMEAVDRAGGEIFAQTVDVSGNPGYWSLLLAHKDSPINSLEDVLKCDKTLDFGIGDPNSTSGFLVPTTYIFAANGVNPTDCFKTVRNANHETNAMSVANGLVDVATNNTENLARIEQNDPDAFKNIKVVWKSPLIPADPIVWRKDMSADLKAKIYYFFMSYGRLGTPEEIKAAREVLAGLAWAPFQPSSDAQLYPIRLLQLNKEKMQVEADDRLSAEEKAAKIGELDAEMDGVQKLEQELPRS